MEDMEKMRKITRNLVENSGSICDEKTKNYIDDKCVASVRLDHDQGYFNTYSHFGIHHEMLSVFINNIKRKIKLVMGHNFTGPSTNRKLQKCNSK